MADISLKNVYKDFFGLAALTDISFEILDNETVVLAGPVGSGKSVILRLIAGIENVLKGGIYFDGKLYNDIPLKKRNVGMVFTKDSYFKNKTIYQNIAYGLKLRKVGIGEIEEKVNKAAEILELKNNLSEKHKHLNSSAKQLVNIARAVIRRPDILLVDEPFSDINNSVHIEKFLTLIKEYPVSCLYATRKFEDVKYLNKKTVVLKDRFIEQAGSFESIYNNPVNKFVAEFFSKPKINFFECLIKRESGGLVLELFDQKFELPKDFVNCEFLEKHLIIGLRPEDILLKKFDNSIEFKCKINYTDNEEGVLIASVKNNGIIVKTGTNIKLDSEIKVYVNLEKILLFDKETELNIRSIKGCASADADNN